MKLIVAYCEKNSGIGINGKIPWNIKEDSIRFQKLTINSIVVMGRKTFESLSGPLKNRTNIVITSNPSVYENGENLIFMTIKEFDSIINNIKNMWIIGGQKLYEKYIDKCDEIYTTVIEGNYNCDTFFPVNKLDNFIAHSKEYKEGYKYITYIRKE